MHIMYCYCMQLRLEGIRGLVVDWNGVLKDMNQLLLQDQWAARHTFDRELALDDIRAMWGTTTAEEFYSQLYGLRVGQGGMPLEHARAILRSYDSLFPKRLVPGVREGLIALHAGGLKLGVVTSGPGDMVRADAAQTGLDMSLLEFFHTGDEIGPDVAAGLPEMTLAVGHFAMLGIGADQLAVIGDEPKNIADASAVNIGQYVLVSAGTMTRDRLLAENVPPERIVDSFDQLPAVFGIEPQTA